MTQDAREVNQKPLAFCPERQRLGDAFMETVRELIELHSQQAQAVINGDSEFARFDDLIHMARERKDSAKYTLIAHLEEHKC